MRFIIILLFTLLSSSICQAQLSLKVNAGCSYNHLITDVSNRKFTENANEIGYSAGFQIKYNVTKLTGFETGICWSQKNYSFIRTEDYSGIFEKFTNNYLQIPFTFQINILEQKKFRVFINNGFFVSYWVCSKVNGRIPNAFDTSNQLDTDGESIQNFYLTNYSEKYHGRINSKDTEKSRNVADTGNLSD